MDPYVIMLFLKLLSSQSSKEKHQVIISKQMHSKRVIFNKCFTQVTRMESLMLLLRTTTTPAV